MGGGPCKWADAPSALPRTTEGEAGKRMGGGSNRSETALAADPFGQLEDVDEAICVIAVSSAVSMPAG